MCVMFCGSLAPGVLSKVFRDLGCMSGTAKLMTCGWAVKLTVINTRFEPEERIQVRTLGFDGSSMMLSPLARASFDFFKWISALYQLKSEFGSLSCALTLMVV